MKRFWMWVLVLGVVGLGWIGEARSETYVTWENLEIDKCASAWLIQRFIDPEAEFRFVPKGSIITEGIPFDVPEAEIRRYHNMSAFEYLLKEYGLDEPGLVKLGAIIHDIEINYWGKKAVEESLEINERIIEVIRASESAEQALDACFSVFDGLYEEYRR